jgi:excisionase family DNA binding protein
MTVRDEVLTVSEVAADLRCSKAHVYNAINGNVTGVLPLPAITMGRRKLVRQSTLERWKRANEHDANGDGMLPPSPEVAPVDA